MQGVSLKAIGLLSIAALSMFGTAHAQIAGVVSRNAISVGPSVSFGGPGINVPSTGTSGPGAQIDLPALAQLGHTDASGVVTHQPGDGVPPPGFLAPLGTFHFARISSANVYFGEWSQSGAVGDGTHATFIVGDTAGTTVPTAGTATYAVKGISDYAGNGLLAGTFNADFAARRLSGSLSGGNYTLVLGPTAVAGTQISGVGAIANVGGVDVATMGTISGRFFGANAATLAGVASFANAHQYDAAFGGTKQ
ncbi:MAG: hypothetical protein GAK28_02823 [Luteibacter sp.]|uniref:Slam-dependent surface lipoprotein n=1 Tax=Luteibacter sp. TaxID=1886636 RepID=UPI0013833592|nr:Slam-dependent surface lipoprotein [Luteibacter sp.]KAF1005915.1 MAG: hypothetical protein GAK28_02823 [Luteibacter sp.]